MQIGNYFYYQVPTTFPSLDLTSVYYVLFCFIAFLLARPFKSFLRPYVLLVMNFIFLWSFSKNLYYLLVALICAIIAYVGGLFIARYRNHHILIGLVVFYVGLLCFFKYAGLLGGTSILLPLGISFYSFKIISYLCDVLNKKVECEINPITLLDHILFFPCITAGPINRSKEFLDELHHPREFDYKEAKGGGFQLVLGIFEKMVFCDFVAQVVGHTLNDPNVMGLNVLVGIFMYSFQIYLDFDSLSNIAIGSARLLGFKIGKNFNSPYLAPTLNDFWRRWHISLSQWFRDYIYIPLGGNRKGKLRRYLNLLIVFVVSGLWHGSTLNFLIWGLLHGFIQIIEDLILRPFKNLRIPDFVCFLLSVVGIAVNFVIVSFLWLIFRSSDLMSVIAVLSRLSAGGSLDLIACGLTVNEVYWLYIVVGIVIITDIMRDMTDMIVVFNNLYFPLRWFVYALMIVVFLIFGVYGGSFSSADFIYRFF